MYEHVNIDGYLNSGHSSILFEHKSNFESSKSFYVQSDSLDNILKENNIANVDVLRLDIEGAEIQALEGSKNT